MIGKTSLVRDAHPAPDTIQFKAKDWLKMIEMSNTEPDFIPFYETILATLEYI
jgi:hypothetical protein